MAQCRLRVDGAVQAACGWRRAGSVWMAQRGDGHTGGGTHEGKRTSRSAAMEMSCVAVFHLPYPDTETT